ncbi:indolepyruvate oxidoreductase [Prosthecochloris sp. GSB1]|uniref:indolepyruvate oxidoreductase subunit beta n=1 Tax=Prosthecochloris sp. GSB1 TaxID=281093 RepID=UPI000B8CB8A9|nr:indolepyruvate oxidoreductase subunit beta [Prosthecochloris sp. GSB1]ASQ90291.1 indolepyruvate oxidoreductase [Prosthecochloris sp. GSB1]
MKKNILLAGVGGQGILSIAAVMDLAAIESGLQIKQAEVHGMSQRGGAVQSHLRISDATIYSDLIPEREAHLILSVEPMEALRYLPWLAEDGVIVSSIDPVRNIPDYPDMEKIAEAIRKAAPHILVNAEALALQAGSSRMANMIVLGAASPWTGLEPGALEKAVRTLFGPKGCEIVDMNIAAFRTGRGLSEKGSGLKAAATAKTTERQRV